MMLYSFLADAVVVVHAAYVLFVVLGMVVILAGIPLGWRWIHNFWFRLAHLATIGIVVVQSLAGVLCPLTILENHLRSKAGEVTYPGSFVGHWAHELIFYDIPPAVFTPFYCLFGAAVLATLFFAPPRWPWKERRDAAPPPPSQG
jgi:hypothetical protein